MKNCAECHAPIREGWPADWLARQLEELPDFKPCVHEHREAPCYTEMMLRDTGVVWRDAVGRSVELGYDMETGELVSIRVAGSVSQIAPRRPTNGRT